LFTSDRRWKKKTWEGAKSSGKRQEKGRDKEVIERQSRNTTSLLLKKH